MEDNNQESLPDGIPISIASAEPAGLDIIRTETVLSRLPVHNLAKQGRVNIQIVQTTSTGEVDLKWEVSYSDRYGQARQLAYKLDTIIVNQRIEVAGRPLPKLLRIGSLNEICAELNLATHAGQNAKDLKRAFLQNASAFINAKFKYKTSDGSERHVEAGITRYGVIFTGEKLPDGRRADAVYISFNDPFWEVLNTAPVRPLDRAYMMTLPPAAQRFYEIVSRKIFAALKNNYTRAKISYSEYCTFSAQLRHLERQRVQDQMAKVIRHHKQSGYIAAVKYEPTIDAQNQPDWVMYLTPGPKAHAEFALANRGRKSKKTIAANAIEVGDRRLVRSRRIGARQVPEIATAPQPTFDPQLVAELTRRGITEKKASELLANLKPGQDVVAQMELGEHMVQNSRIPIVNPPGFYIRLVESNMSVPESFATNAKRKAREESERKERERRAEEDARQLLEWEYDDYCHRETDRFIAENLATFEAVKDAKRTENRDRHQAFSTELIESIAQNEAKREIQKQAPLLTFDEFVDRKKQGTDFSLKLVAVSPAIELAPTISPPQEVTAIDEPGAYPDATTTAEMGETTTTAPDAPPPHILDVDEQPASVPSDPEPPAEREAEIEPAPEPATNPAIAEPAIELVAESASEEGNLNLAEQG